MASKIQWTPEIVPNGGLNETKSSTQIEDNQWSSASNIEPLIDGARTRNGTGKSNSIALQAINIEHEAGTSGREFVDGTSEYIAQQFTVGGSNITVSRVAVRLGVITDTSPSATGNVECAIYSDAAPGPNAEVTGLTFALFDTLDSSTITNEYKWYHFTVATGVALTASAVHHLVIRFTGAGATGTNTIDIEEVTTPSGYSGGQVYFDDEGTAGTWTGVAAADLNFRIYSGAAAITGIFDYWLSDGTTQRHLVSADKEIYKNVSGTMTAVSSRLRAGFTASADTFTDFSVANDVCMIAHGTDTPTKFYVNSGTEYYENQGIAPPTAVLTPSAIAGGSLPDDTWDINWILWNDDTGQGSTPRYVVTGTLTQATTGGNNSIRLSGLPTAVSRTGDRATHIRVYLRRSVSVIESVFTFAGTAANQGQTPLDSTTTFDITSRGTGTVLDFDHTVPNTHNTGFVAENRYFTNDTSRPYRLWYSKIQGITALYESFPTTNFRDFGKGDGDYITFIGFMPPRSLIVGFKNSIYVIDARRPGTSDRNKIAEGVGIAGRNAARIVGRTLYFISDADRSKGPYVWEGSGEPKPVLGVDNTFKGMNQTRLEHASCVYYEPGDTRFQWWTLLASSGQSSSDRVLVYDRVLQAWAPYSISANVAGEVDVSGITRLFLGGTDGFERQADSGTQDDTTDIASNFQMKDYDFGTQRDRKRMRFIDYVVLEKTAGSINAAFRYDFGQGVQFSATLGHIGSTNVAVWATDAWGDGSVWGSPSNDLTNRVSLRGVGKYAGPKFNSDTQFHIKAFSLAAQPLGRRG